MDSFGATQQMNASDKTMMTPMGGGQVTIMGAPVRCPICETDNAPTEKYCGECGFLLASTPVETAPPPPTEQPRLVASSGQGEFFLKQGENSVGREGTDVLLGDPTVSRRHARITLQDGKCWVEDFGSTNGTYVAGSQVGKTERVELPDGGEVKFGSVALFLKMPVAMEAAPAEATQMLEAARQVEATQALDVVQVEGKSSEVSDQTDQEDRTDGTNVTDQSDQTDQSEASETVSAVESAPVEEPVAEVQASPATLTLSSDASKVFNIEEGVNTIGRRAGNSIVLSDDPYVSGSHAQIVVDQLGMWLVDVGSTNGTTLNGTRINPNSRMALSGSDDITFGQTSMKFTAENNQ